MNAKLAGFGLIGVALGLLIILAVLKADLDAKNEYLCEVIDASPELSMEQCPAHNSSSSWFITAAFGFGILLLAAGGYLVLRERPAKKASLPRLDDDERIIHNYLKAHEGSAYQSDIIRDCDLSKVRVSRILDRLEGKQLVERKRRGMTNIIVLR